MKKILVGVDGSDCSLDALRVACGIAKGMGGSVIVAHVIPPRLHTRIEEPEPALESEEARRSELLLSRACDIAGEFNVGVEKAYLHGKAPEQLAHYASVHSCDLVVVGSRGRGAVSRMILGSVADRVVRICPQSVLIVR